MKSSVVNVFNRKTRKGTLMRFAKEHYLRSDIRCQSQLCSHSIDEEYAGLLSCFFKTNICHSSKGCGGTESGDEAPPSTSTSIDTYLSKLQISDIEQAVPGGSANDK
jgi:hypothetical protein